MTMPTCKAALPVGPNGRLTQALRRVEYVTPVFAPTTPGDLSTSLGDEKDAEVYGSGPFLLTALAVSIALAAPAPVFVLLFDATDAAQTIAAPQYGWPKYILGPFAAGAGQILGPEELFALSDGTKVGGMPFDTGLVVRSALGRQYRTGTAPIGAYMRLLARGMP